MGLACGQTDIFLQGKISTVQKNVLQGIYVSGGQVGM